MRTKEEIELMRRILASMIVESDENSLLDKALALEQIDAMNWCVGAKSSLDELWEIANEENEQASLNN
jgi:hypothetical protein